MGVAALHSGADQQSLPSDACTLLARLTLLVQVTHSRALHGTSSASSLVPLCLGGCQTPACLALALWASYPCRAPVQDVRVVPEPPSDSSGISRLRIRLVCQGRLFGQAQFEPHTCWAMGLAMSRCMKPVSSSRNSPRTEAAIARLVPGKAALLDLLFPCRSPPAGSFLAMMGLSCSLPENNHSSLEMVGSFPGPVFFG